MRQITFINRDWLYTPQFENAYIEKGYNYEGFEKIELPHTNKVLPYNYLNEADYQFVSCYVKKLHVDGACRDKKLFLDFEGVMCAAKVYCNGTFICEHKGGYTFFEAELTNEVIYGEENTIVVEVDSRERADVPPFGNVVDYLTYGGIYREVSLRVVENTYVNHAFIKTNDCLKEKKTLTAELVLAGGGKNVEVTVQLKDGEKLLQEKTATKEEVQDEEKLTVVLEDLTDIELWDIHNPKRYEVVINYKVEGELVDTRVEQVGFRHVHFAVDGFYLNGELLKIIGLNRHQAYPYVGYAMPKRVQEKDADILKYEMGLNLVRTSHYPQSKHFLNRCDEIGLLVFEEIPGWQYIGDEVWQNVSLQNVREMITRDFNHPSIILWGVRINESGDHHEFYTKTNALAHALDDTRQTGGVRCIEKSELLEDVYTFNDFVHDGGSQILRQREQVTGLSYPVPLLVTENNGHMYPTKRFDYEKKLVEHAARHLRVVNEALGSKETAGNISWCAFDYNTHGCFGSGDKICYHGVSDMFRLPKYAAHAYACQKDQSQGAVLEIASVISRGEKAGGGIGHIHVFTNCDSIKVYKNGEFVSNFYPNAEAYPHLEHPPIVVNHLITEVIDLGIAKEDAKEIRTWIVNKLKESSIYDRTKEEETYLEQIAEKNNVEVHKLLGAIGSCADGWGDKSINLVLEGYIKDECVITKQAGEEKYMADLVVTADDTVLQANAESYDATRVVVKVVDNLGQLTPFINEIAVVEVEGPAEVMGPKQFALQGGISAFWLRTTGMSGTVKIHVRSMYFEKTVAIKVK